VVARWKLVDGNVALLRFPAIKGAPQLNKAELETAAKNHIRLLHKDVIKDYKPADWGREWDVAYADAHKLLF
jgi:hypothetical protein